VVEERLGWIRIGTQRRLSCAKNTRFLKTDAVAIGAQPVGMIKRYCRHNGDIRFVGIDRVKPPAQTHLENDGLDTGLSKNLPCGQCAKFKIGQCYVAGLLPRSFDPGKSRTQDLVARRYTVQANAFVIHHEMRRGVAAHLIAGTVDDVFQIGTGRTFAIGATDDDDRAMLSLPEHVLDQANPVKAQFDAGVPFGVQAFEMGQPIFQCLQAIAGNFCSSARTLATWSRNSRRSTIMSIAPFSMMNSER
jgi:hypothetical protein